ncbi:hypothetical protein EBESD8_1820 [Rhodococcus aetherivorans]|nr:hypothetical protein EBESD8_1820 [Rhodococcus aetherivorans]
MHRGQRPVGVDQTAGRHRPQQRHAPTRRERSFRTRRHPGLSLLQRHLRTPPSPVEAARGRVQSRHHRGASHRAGGDPRITLGTMGKTGPFEAARHAAYGT